MTPAKAQILVHLNIKVLPFFTPRSSRSKWHAKK